jgi:hypothetical protein
VREHRTDRLKGCRSKTADNWVPASGGRSAASNPVGGADLTDPRRGRRLINPACLILLPTDATVPLLLDFDEAQSIGYIEYPNWCHLHQDQDQVGACTLSEGSVVRSYAVEVRFRRCHRCTRRDLEDEFGGLR